MLLMLIKHYKTSKNMKLDNTKRLKIYLYNALLEFLIWLGSGSSDSGGKR